MLYHTQSTLQLNITKSEATIKVHDGKGANKHRQIHLGGSALQVGISLTSFYGCVKAALVFSRGCEMGGLGGMGSFCGMRNVPGEIRSKKFFAGILNVPMRTAVLELARGASSL
ncbi:hypothetical protein Tco_1010439 [Tanacetum coccineum]